MAQAYTLKTQGAGAGDQEFKGGPSYISNLRPGGLLHKTLTQTNNKITTAAKIRKERKSSKSSQIGYLVRTYLITQGSLSNYGLLAS